MNTDTELESAFRLYLDEIDLCLKHQCYWALVHLLVALPAVCVALQQETGSTEQNDKILYTEWCSDNGLLNTPLGGEWYGLRCKILHQGRTQTVAFVEPSSIGHPSHGTKEEGRLYLGYAETCAEIKQAVRAWFARVVNDPTLWKKVQRNLPSLARQESAQYGSSGGLTFATTTTSSRSPSKTILIP